MNRWFDNLPFIGDKVPGKIVLSFLILLLPFSLFLTFGTYDRLVCLYAMLFSFFGDVALNHKKKTNETEKESFIVGGISFGISQMLYFFAYCRLIVLNHYKYLNNGFFIALLLLIALTIFLVLISKEKSKMLALGIVYLWISGINYCTIFSYSFSAISIACLGGLFFLASDVIIGLEQFAKLKSKLARELVWWLYPIGQIIIIICA